MNIAKGCGVRSEINKTSLQFEGTKYDPQRKCWVSRLTKGRERFADAAMDVGGGGEGVVSRDLVEALGLEEDRFEMHQQVRKKYNNVFVKSWGVAKNRKRLNFIFLCFKESYKSSFWNN